jgi:hypothetical protein
LTQSTKGSRDVRPARHRIVTQGTHPGERRRVWVIRVNPQGVIRDDTLARTRSGFGWDLCSRACASQRTPRLVSERTPHEEEGRGPVCEDGHPATPTELRSSLRARLQSDEENVRFLMRIRGRVRSVGTATERDSPTHERSWTNNGESSATATVCRRGATVIRASSKLGHSARNDMKATSKGNKAQGGQANERPNTALAGTDRPAEQGLEGPRPSDTTKRRSWKRRRREAADRRRRKVRGGKGRGDAHRTGWKRLELRVGRVLRGVRTSMRETAVRVTSTERRQQWHRSRGWRHTNEAEETHRTLRLAARCNKLASPSSP